MTDRQKKQSSISFDSVAKACESLFAEGKSPTFRTVYALLGNKGGAAVVQKHIEAWRQSVAEKLTAERESPALPQELVAIADGMVQALWTQALDKSEQAYADRNAELERDRIVWSERVTSAEDRADQLDRQLLALRGELQAKEATIDGQLTRLEDLQSRLTASVEVVRGKDVLIADLRAEITRTLTTLENERKQYQQEISTVRAIGVADLANMQAAAEREHKSLRERHAAELAAHAEAAEGLRKHLVMQTDAVRQEGKANHARLSKALEEQQALVDQYKRQANNAIDQAGEARGRADLLAEQLAATQKQLADATGRLAALEARSRVKAETAGGKAKK